jgi:hypothetical protein
MRTSPTDAEDAAPTHAGSSPQPLPPHTYLIVSAAGLAIAVGLLLFLVFGASRIMAAGLDHRVFYVLLVPLGLSAAAFAFGAMNSSGSFTQHGTRQVGLTGPAMFAALVVVGGFFLVPQGGPRSLVVRVDRDAAAGGGPVAGASVSLDWGSQRIVQITDGSGQASFVGLAPGPSLIDVTVEASGHVSERVSLASVPLNGAVRFELAAREQLTRVRGTVFDRATGAPLPGVALSFGSGAAAATSDAAGDFAVDPALAPGARIIVVGTRDGVRGVNTEVTVSADMPVHLHFGSGG